MKKNTKTPIQSSIICTSRAMMIYLLLTIPLLADRQVYFQSAINAVISSLLIFGLFTLFLYWYKSKVKITQQKIFTLLNIILVLGFLTVMSGIVLSYAFLRLEVFTLYVDKLLFPIIGVLSFSLAVWSYRRSMYIMLIRNHSQHIISNPNKIIS